MAKVVTFSLFFIISQVSIFAQNKGIDFNSKNDQFKKFPKKILQFKKIKIQKEPTILAKDKISLKLVNKYQFRRDLNNKKDIPIKEIAIKPVK